LRSWQSAGWNASACFHAQQCGEKWIKAVLLSNGLPPTRTHDLDALLDLLEQASVDLAPVREAATVLTEYAVDARYPDADDINREGANAAVQYARALHEWAGTLLL
jgi:HEPN domain-containing protein